MDKVNENAAAEAAEAAAVKAAAKAAAKEAKAAPEPTQGPRTVKEGSLTIQYR